MSPLPYNLSWHSTSAEIIEAKGNLKMNCLLVGLCLAIVGVYLGFRGAEWARNWAKANIGDSRKSQLWVNALMVGLAVMLLVITLSTLTA